MNEKYLRASRINLKRLAKKIARSVLIFGKMFRSDRISFLPDYFWQNEREKNEPGSIGIRIIESHFSKIVDAE